MIKSILFPSRNSIVRKSFSFFLLFGILISLGSVLFSVNNKVVAEVRPSERAGSQTVKVIYAPTIGLPESQGSDIVLNCRSIHDMDLTPTFYTADGEAIVGDVIRVKPSEIRFLDIESLIPANHRKKHVWGGMTLSYVGKMMEAWAQITLRGKGQRESADVTFSVLNGLGSDTQEAVWLQPKPGKTVIALGNSSDTSIQTNLLFSNGDTQDVNIAPHATQYVRRNSSNGSGNNSELGVGESVKLTTNGPAGSLKATGYIYSNSAKFASGIRFYDIKDIVQPKLFATNLRVKNSKMSMLLKNTTETVITVKPIFRPMEGSGVPVEFSYSTLSPGEIKEINLQALETAAASRSDLNEVSVEVENDNTSGSLIGALYSLNKTTEVIYDVPLRDSGKLRNSTGAYPWRLDGDYKTTVTITNPSSGSARFRMSILFDGGQYLLPIETLESGKSAKFNVNRLRDEQIPDEKGRVIPKTATVGQFTWSILGAKTNRLIGRSEVVSKSQNISSSYSCNICCADNGPDFGMTGPIFLIAGLAGNFPTTETWTTCNQQQYSYNTNIVGAAVADPSIAQITGGYSGVTTFTGYSGGQTSWYGDPYTYFNHQEGPYDCYEDNFEMTPGGPVEVAPMVNITPIKAVGKNYNASIKFEIENSGNLPIDLKLEPDAGASGSAVFTNTNSNTRQIFQSSDVEIKGTMQSSTSVSMNLKASYKKSNNEIVELTSIKFTVISVTLSLRYGDGDPISGDNLASGTYQSVLGRGTLGGPFFSNGTGLNLWRHGIEIKGTISPSDFAEFVVLRREITESRSYDDQTIKSRIIGCPDTSLNSFLDQDPQSSPSQGIVYDLDAPGINITSGPQGSILRRRTNWKQWASVFQMNGNNPEYVRVSDDINWYQRLSIILTMNLITQPINDVSGDNTIGAGTTALTWNFSGRTTFQFPSPCPPNSN